MYQYSSSKNYFSSETDPYHTSYANQSMRSDDEFDEFLESAKLGELSGIKSYLQKNFFNVNAYDSSGWTALMYAASYGHYNIIKSLLDHGANTNLKEFQLGRTALMMAASNGHTRCIEMLVQGKADIRLKDNNNYSAAYYATHYGHGSNKIIARLLKIPGISNTTSQYTSSFNNNCMNSSFTSKHSNGHLSSFDSPTANYTNNERYNLFLNQHNSSLNDENDLSHYSSFNTSADHYSSSERRYSTDTQSSQLSCSLMSNTHQSLHDILKRTQPKPRALFKQKSRRLSPAAHQQLLDANGGNNILGSLNKELTNVQTMNTLNGKRYSLGCVNIMQNLEQSATANALRSNSLSLDLNSNQRQTSPNGFSPEFGAAPKSQNYFHYDSVFESPQSSNSDQQSFTEKLNAKLESSFNNLEISWNDTNESLDNLNKRNKPRNSTFVSNGTAVKHATLSDSLSPTGSEELSSLEIKYAGLAGNLDEFLRQTNLEELADLFAKHKVGLYGFLSMGEDELKQLGIQNPEHLATLIAGQLKFKEAIGVESLESMSFICYLGNQLDKARKEMESLKKEFETHKMCLYDMK